MFLRTIAASSIAVASLALGGVAAAEGLPLSTTVADGSEQQFCDIPPRQLPPTGSAATPEYHAPMRELVPCGDPFILGEAEWGPGVTN